MEQRVSSFSSDTHPMLNWDSFVPTCTRNKANDNYKCALAPFQLTGPHLHEGLRDGAPVSLGDSTALQNVAVPSWVCISQGARV